MAALTDVLAGYPLWVGERVVTHLVLTEKWLPAIASVYKRCEEDIRPARQAAEWDRAASIIKLDAPDRSRRPTMEELQAKHGPNWGITDVDRPAKRVPTQAEALAKLRAEFGDLVDQVPDAPPRRDDMKRLR